MPVADSAECRELLTHLFPGIEIERNLRASGQRLVYFCRFTDRTDVDTQKNWAQWGDVVLKLSEDIHPTVIARLEKEREILNGLNSPHYPKQLYFEVFSSDPVTDRKFAHRLFITIEERVGGAPLGECRDYYRVESRVVDLLAQLVDALTLLWNHPQRIIHRDLKPDNIIVGVDHIPVIIDLGIIREQGAAGVTGTGWNVGPCTPAYASPEQLKNEKRFITFKADFFSLGVIVYELLSGTNPFSNDPNEPAEIVMHRALTHEPVPLLADGHATLPLSTLVRSLMAKQPYLRPRTIEELKERVAALREPA